MHPWWLAVKEKKKKKKLAPEIIDTRATHNGLNHDVMYTDTPAQNGSAQGYVFATFKHHF